LLAKLARIYLAVQVTSSPSEREFGSASHAITAKHNTILDTDMAGKQ
jgi:hypothetical protein